MVRTTVSLPRGLLDRIETLAAERQVSRSQLFSAALEEYFRREESRQLLERLDRVHGGEVTPAEKELARRQRRSHRRQVQGEG